MALEENNMVMPVTSMGGNGGFGGFGGDLGWLIIILLFAFGGFGGGFGGNEIYPWMNQADITTSGFQNLTTQNQIGAIGTGIDSLQLAMINGFAGIEAGANARQMADMQTSFNMQTAMNSGFNGLQSQLAQCCCDNRLATVQTQNIVQSEGAATRLSIQNQTQQILDKLCALEIDNLKTQLDAKNDRIVDLQNQLNMASFNASQVAQTAQIISNITPAARVS